MQIYLALLGTNIINERRTVQDCVEKSEVAKLFVHEQSQHEPNDVGHQLQAFVVLDKSRRSTYFRKDVSEGFPHSLIMHQRYEHSFLFDCNWLRLEQQAPKLISQNLLVVFEGFRWRQHLPFVLGLFLLARVLLYIVFLQHCRLLQGCLLA